MAYQAGLTAAIGAATKASDYDDLAANTDANNDLLPVDGVVDAAGNGGYTTLQAGDDALDGDALDGDAYSMWVKEGTYAAGLTVSTAGAMIYMEPLTIVQAAIVLSGNNVTLRLGAGCDIQALITLSGTGATLICENGCQLDGIVVSGDEASVDGGGWDTLVDGGVANHAINVTGARVGVKNIRVKTTGGGGQNYNGIHVAATKVRITNVWVEDSDNEGIDLHTAGTYGLVEGCEFTDADDACLMVRGNRARIIGNHIVSSSGTAALRLTSTADNFCIVGNHVEDTGVGIQMDTNCDDGLCVGNVHDGTLTNDGTGNTVANNEPY